MLSEILLGLALGSLTAGVCAWFFIITRRYRKTGRFSVIAFCQVTFAILCAGSALLIAEVLPAGDAAGGAYVIALGTGAVIGYRSEMRWRKEIGLRK
jgi:hypothetical protein